MKPIVHLGEWRNPLRAHELESLADGFAKPPKQADDETVRIWRKAELRAWLAGIDLPDWRSPEYADDDPDSWRKSRYKHDCERAVLKFYVEHSRPGKRVDNDRLLASLFESVSESDLRERAIKAGLLPADSPRD